MKALPVGIECILNSHCDSYPYEEVKDYINKEFVIVEIKKGGYYIIGDKASQTVLLRVKRSQVDLKTDRLTVYQLSEMLDELIKNSKGHLKLNIRNNDPFSNTTKRSLPAKALKEEYDTLSGWDNVICIE